MDKKEIKTDKLTIDAVFSDWYNVPSYQRHYVWDRDNILDLIEDISQAAENTPNDEYFLGSYVIQNKTQNGGKDLLDGQQRLTTLFLIFATLRDMSQSTQETVTECQKYVLQEANKIKRIEQRVRILFQIRDDVEQFVEDYIVPKDKIRENLSFLKNLSEEKKISPSIRNISQAILVIYDYFKDKTAEYIETFLSHLVNNVVLIYVSADSLHDAFKFFSILNDRGAKLGNSDIIKSINLQACTTKEQERYAKIWEDMQMEIDDDFERFLSLVRTIVIKEKAKNNLLYEFENLIFKTNVIKPGKEFFDFIKGASAAYQTVMDGNITNISGNYYTYNLIQLMHTSFPSSDWIAVMMAFVMKFNGCSDDEKKEFTRKVICKTVADVACGESPTKRIENLNNIIKEIDKVNNIQALLNNQSIFYVDKNRFNTALSGDIYGRSHCKTLLFILDFIVNDNDTVQWRGFNHVSVEHILPQTPNPNSQWRIDFPDNVRSLYTHKLGNLCLLGRRKNTSQGNLDYILKKEKYFKNNIGLFPNSIRINNKYNKWEMSDFDENQSYCIEKLNDFFNC